MSAPEPLPLFIVAAGRQAAEGWCRVKGVPLRRPLVRYVVTPEDLRGIGQGLVVFVGNWSQANRSVVEMAHALVARQTLRDATADPDETLDPYRPAVGLFDPFLNFTQEGA
jgi:hypothetical protein